VDTAAFDYDLPEARIAQHPVEPRDAARLLVDTPAGPEHHHVRDLPDLLDPGDLVVVNTTRVLPARLRLAKSSGGAVEVLLLEPRTPSTWEALVRPGRRVPPGTVLRHPDHPDLLTATVGEDVGEGIRLVELATGGSIELLGSIEATGEMPLPPYIHEPLADQERYQTVYSVGRTPTSAAAPTAGLHLTPALLERIGDRGVGIVDVELIVGLGTFRPIEAEKVEDHRMHRERYRVPTSTFEACRATHERGGRVVAVGTTAVRALESAALTGELEGHTDLFIHEGFEFRLVDRLMTNFHLPRSSLLVMIDAFAGPRWRDLYAAALAGDYRFLSFGDAMLLTGERSWNGPLRRGT
jgi:S-adenosylmethionine:tRNA ribosyltransferase-isomerase